MNSLVEARLFHFESSSLGLVFNNIYTARRTFWHFLLKKLRKELGDLEADTHVAGSSTKRRGALKGTHHGKEKGLDEPYSQ